MRFVAVLKQFRDGKVLLLSVGTLPERYTRAVGFRNLFNSNRERKDTNGILFWFEFEQSRKRMCCNESVGVGRTRGAGIRNGVRIDRCVCIFIWICCSFACYRLISRVISALQLGGSGNFYGEKSLLLLPDD